MSKWKDNAVQKYKEECFKQTRPYQFELAYALEEGGGPDGNPPVSASGTLITFPKDDGNVLGFAGINTEYIVFASKDGVFEPDMMEKLISKGRGADIIYCDEDFVTDMNADLSDINVRIRKLRTPWRKPEYSPHTILSFPYIECCFAIRTTFARSVPALKKSPEISDNVRVWDFFLRATERTMQIVHITDVLYHRSLEALMGYDESQQEISDEQIFEKLAQKYEKPGYQLCREAAANRRGVNRQIEVDKDKPLVSIIIPSKDQPKMLKACIRNIRMNAGSVPFEIIVVDNGSSQENRTEIESVIEDMPENMATYLYNEFEFDFSRMCNLGAVEAKGDFLLFLNDDVDAVSEKFLEKMLKYAQLPEAGAVGLKLLYPDDRRIQHVGITDINRGPTHKLITLSDDTVHYYCRNRFVWDVLAVTGACLMVEKSKYFQVGGFNDQLKIAYNDVDLCVKLYESGYYNIVNNECFLIHKESFSRGADITPQKAARLKIERILFYNAHQWLRNCSDPFYSPYLDGDTIEIKSYVIPDYQATDFRNKTKELAKLPAKPGRKAMMSIDRCFTEYGIGEKAEDAYVFDGWGVVPKGDNSLYKRYMVFVPLDEDGVMVNECLLATVSPKYRTDIENVFEEAYNLRLSGFECRVPVSKLDRNRQYCLGILIQKRGGFETKMLSLGEIYEPGRGIITEN